MQLGDQAHTGDGHLGVISIELAAKDLSDPEGHRMVRKKRARVPGSLSKGAENVLLTECMV